MSRYRKKIEEVEAFQLTEKRRWDPTTWPPWLVAAWKKPNDEVGSVYPTPGTGDPTITVRLPLLELQVDFNDWIIQDERGRMYSCKPDIFNATYEPIDPDATVAMPPPDCKATAVVEG